jgi:hypothetical protein
MPAAFWGGDDVAARARAVSVPTASTAHGGGVSGGVGGGVGGGGGARMPAAFWGGDGVAARARAVSVPTASAAQGGGVGGDVGGGGGVGAGAGAPLEYDPRALRDAIAWFKWKIYEEHPERPLASRELPNLSKKQAWEKLKLICRHGALEGSARRQTWMTIFGIDPGSAAFSELAIAYRFILQSKVNSCPGCAALLPSHLHRFGARFLSTSSLWGENVFDKHALSAAGLAAAQRVMHVLHMRYHVVYAPQIPDLTCILLLYLSEEEAFCTLANMLEGSLKRVRWSKDAREGTGAISHFLPLSRIEASVFELTFLDLVKERCGTLHHHLLQFVREPDELHSHFMSWFERFFVGVLPLRFVVRIVDCFFVEGAKVLYRVGLTLLRNFRSHILVACSRYKRGEKSVADLFEECLAELGSHRESKIPAPLNPRLSRLEAALRDATDAGVAAGRERGGSFSSLGSLLGVDKPARRPSMSSAGSLTERAARRVPTPIVSTFQGQGADAGSEGTSKSALSADSRGSVLNGLWDTKPAPSDQAPEASAAQAASAAPAAPVLAGRASKLAKGLFFPIAAAKAAGQATPGSPKSADSAAAAAPDSPPLSDGGGASAGGGSPDPAVALSPSVLRVVRNWAKRVKTPSSTEEPAPAPAPAPALAAQAQCEEESKEDPENLAPAPPAAVKPRSLFKKPGFKLDMPALALPVFSLSVGPLSPSNMMQGLTSKAASRFSPRASPKPSAAQPPSPSGVAPDARSGSTPVAATHKEMTEEEGHDEEERKERDEELPGMSSVADSMNLADGSSASLSSASSDKSASSAAPSRHGIKLLSLFNRDAASGGGGSSSPQGGEEAGSSKPVYATGLGHGAMLSTPKSTSAHAPTSPTSADKQAEAGRARRASEMAPGGSPHSSSSRAGRAWSPFMNAGGLSEAAEDVDADDSKAEPASPIVMQAPASSATGLFELGTLSVNDFSLRGWNARAKLVGAAGVQAHARPPSNGEAEAEEARQPDNVIIVQNRIGSKVFYSESSLLKSNTVAGAHLLLKVMGDGPVMHDLDSGPDNFEFKMLLGSAFGWRNLSSASLKKHDEAHRMALKRDRSQLEQVFGGPVPVHFPERLLHESCILRSLGEADALMQWLPDKARQQARQLELVFSLRHHSQSLTGLYEACAKANKGGRPRLFGSLLLITCVGHDGAEAGAFGAYVPGTFAPHSKSEDPHNKPQHHQLLCDDSFLLFRIRPRPQVWSRACAVDLVQIRRGLVVPRSRLRALASAASITSSWSNSSQSPASRDPADRLRLAAVGGSFGGHLGEVDDDQILDDVLEQEARSSFLCSSVRGIRFGTHSLAYVNAACARVDPDDTKDLTDQEVEQLQLRQVSMGPGLWLNEDLTQGHTAWCNSFENEALCLTGAARGRDAERRRQFTVLNVEVFGIPTIGHSR